MNRSLNVTLVILSHIYTQTDWSIESICLLELPTVNEHIALRTKTTNCIGIWSMGSNHTALTSPFRIISSDMRAKKSMYAGLPLTDPPADLLATQGEPCKLRGPRSTSSFCPDHSCNETGFETCLFRITFRNISQLGLGVCESVVRCMQLFSASFFTLMILVWHTPQFHAHRLNFANDGALICS